MIAPERLRLLWREAQRRRRVRLAGGLAPLRRGWSSKGKAHKPASGHPWQRDKNRAADEKLARLEAMLDTDWDLPPPGPENERYSRMSVDELCAELNLHALVDGRD